jgi:hypothetical protein
MFLHITCDQSGHTLLSRKLRGAEILDCDLYAAQFAADHFDAALDMRGGHVPAHCGDFTVELADNPGTGVCWTSQSYFLETEG